MDEMNSAESKPSSEPVRRFRYGLSWSGIPWLLLTVVLFGGVIRLGFRDREAWAAPIYYALPIILLALVTLIAGLFWFVLGRRRYGIVTFIAALLLVMWSANETVYWNPVEPPNADTLRVVFWNTARRSLETSDIARTILAVQPDVIGLVESCQAPGETLADWKAAFPGYSVSDEYRGILLLTRGEMYDISRLRFRGGTCKYARVNQNGRMFHVAVADIASSPRRNRQQPLEMLAEKLLPLESLPVLLMGDFNTPADSVHFRKLRSRYTNAFEVAGSGYAATWPLPFPLIQIDHIWTSNRVHVQSCRMGLSGSSDHRPIFAHIRLLPVSETAKSP